MDNLKITVHQWTPDERDALEAFYAGLRQLWDSMTLWYDLKEPDSEAGAQAFRDMMKNGGTTWPTPERLDDIAQDIQVPTRSGVSAVYMRVFKPDPSKTTQSRGIYMHLHSGGWVLGAADIQDQALYRLANEIGYTIASVEYRLAPKWPYPAAVHDCIDAAKYLLTTESEKGLGPLKIIGGESAGAHLTMLTAFALREDGVDLRKQFDCLVFNYGIFDVSETPSARSYSDNLVLGLKDLRAFADAWVVNGEDRRDPKISPLYESDWTHLPNAVFMVGTNDPLFDDTLFAAIKWHMNGNSAELTILPGSYHGVGSIGGPDTAAALGVSEEFIRRLKGGQTR